MSYCVIFVLRREQTLLRTVSREDTTAYLTALHLTLDKLPTTHAFLFAENQNLATITVLKRPEGCRQKSSSHTRHATELLLIISENSTQRLHLVVVVVQKVKMSNISLFSPTCLQNSPPRPPCQQAGCVHPSLTSRFGVSNPCYGVEVDKANEKWEGAGGKMFVVHQRGPDPSIIDPPNTTFKGFESLFRR